MKMVLLLVALGIAGWWMWTSLGGSSGPSSLPGGGPEPVLKAAQSATDTANEANRKMQDALHQALPPGQ